MIVRLPPNHPSPERGQWRRKAKAINDFYMTVVTAARPKS